MKKLVMLGAMVAAATALAAAPAPAKFEMKGDAAKGKVTFEQFCVPCHGAEGKGDGVAGAALNPHPADFTDPKRAALTTDEQIYNLIKEGGQAYGKSPLMVSWKATLNDQQIRDVATYIRNFSKAARDAMGKTPPGKTPAPAPAPKK